MAILENSYNEFVLLLWIIAYLFILVLNESFLFLVRSKGPWQRYKKKQVMKISKYKSISKLRLDEVKTSRKKWKKVAVLQFIKNFCYFKTFTFMRVTSNDMAGIKWKFDIYEVVTCFNEDYKTLNS